MNLEMLISNLETATKEVALRKLKNPNLRFRIETRVNKDTVKVYAIQKNRITAVFTYDGDYCKEDIKDTQ